MVDESVPRATSNKEEKRREVTGQHTALGPMRLQEEETAYVDEAPTPSKQGKEGGVPLSLLPKAVCLIEAFLSLPLLSNFNQLYP